MVGVVTADLKSLPRQRRGDDPRFAERHLIVNVRLREKWQEQEQGG